MVVWNLQFSVSNIVRATYLEAVQRCQIYIVLKNSIHVTVMKVITHRQPAFFALLLRGLP